MTKRMLLKNINVMSRSEILISALCFLLFGYIIGFSVGSIVIRKTINETNMHDISRLKQRIDNITQDVGELEYVIDFIIKNHK